MEDLGFNWERHPMQQHKWVNDVAVLKWAVIFSSLMLIFYGCKNFKISNTKYIRGRQVSFV